MESNKTQQSQDGSRNVKKSEADYTPESKINDCNEFQWIVERYIIFRLESAAKKEGSSAKGAQEGSSWWAQEILAGYQNWKDMIKTMKWNKIVTT